MIPLLAAALRTYLGSPSRAISPRCFATIDSTRAQKSGPSAPWLASAPMPPIFASTARSTAAWTSEALTGAFSRRLASR
eukprot:13827682-Heterocapsa_arctica.AAC.1